MQNEVEVLKRLIELSDYFKEDLSGSMQDVYLTAFERYSDEQIFKAIGEAYFLKYFPRLHAFKELIDGKKEDKANIAWQLLLDTIDKKGSYNSYEFEDKKIHSAVKACGGMLAVADCPLDGLVWKRKDFIEAYNLNHNYECDYLVGRHELSNSMIGVATKPIAIGNVEKRPELTDGKKEEFKKVGELIKGIGDE